MSKVVNFKNTKKDETDENWCSSLNETFNFHDINPTHWTSVNEDIVDALKTDGTIPPVTFASHVTLDHIKSELDFEILRMEQRLNTELSKTAQYFRSTYAKYCVWVMACKATLTRNLVAVPTIVDKYKLSETGVRTIFEEASDAGYLHKIKIGKGYRYCASNVTMRAWVDRSLREVHFFTEEKLKNIQAFKSFLNYLPNAQTLTSNDWYDLKK